MRNDELRSLLGQGAAAEARPTGGCPDEGEIAGFIDGALGADETRRLREHLAGCDHCLARVGFLARLEDAEPPEVPQELLARVRDFSDGRAATAGHKRRWGAAAAAAAVIMLFLWVGRLGEIDRRDEPPSDVRVGAELLQPPEILSPSEGAMVAPGRLDELELRWTRVPQAIFYEIRLVTADGVRVWDGRSESERQRLPAGLGVAAGQELFVWVRAYLPEGKTLQSEVVGFRVAGGRGLLE